MKSVTSLLALGALVALLVSPAAAAGDVDCGCPRGGCHCDHRAALRTGPADCQTALRFEGQGCGRRPSRAALASPSLPDGELAAPGLRPEDRPAAPPPTPDPKAPTPLADPIEPPPPRA